MHVILIEFRFVTPYPVQLANALGELCQVTLMLPEAASRFATELDQDKVDLQFFQLPRYRQPLKMAAMVRHLNRQLKSLTPDVVHVTFWHVWGTPGLGIFAPFPLISTVHDVTRHSGERGLSGIPPVLYRWQWRWADQVIVHASEAKRKLLSEYGCQPDQVHVVPIGSYDFYRTFAPKEQMEQPNTILFFGRIWGYKGLQYLIEAEPLIAQVIPDIRIIIAGAGENFDKYRKAMVNPECFEVHNYRIPDDQVAQFFQQASIVVLPYIEASQSGVVSVAYAFGKPVIATRVGGLPDVVIEGQTGLLVPPADSRSLAEAIIKLLIDNSLRHKMGRLAKQFAESELSWERIAQKTMGIYQQALNKLSKS